MPTERMEEVEVVCPWCGGDGCHDCNDSGTTKEVVAPGSLTSARLRLADAAEAWWMATGAAVDHSREWATLLAALSALRTARGER